MNNKAIISLVVAVIVGGLGFYGGTIYAKKGSAVQTSGRGGVGAAGGRAGGFAAGLGARNGGGFIAGDVISKDATSVTIKFRDGGSKIIFYSASTTVGKMTTGSMDDVSQGTNVTVMGTTNQDGSVTASTVQIRPMGEGIGGPGSGPAPTTTGTSSADAREIVLTSSNFTFEPSTITVKKGEKIRIKLKNVEGLHDWKVDEFNAATERINGEAETFIEFTPDKTGTFEYYCSVGSHRQMGMKGMLTVTE